jgi:Zn-dependent alcohol dehydrogenase
MLLDGTTRLHTLDGVDLKHYLTASTMSERMVFMEDSLLPVPGDVPDEVAAITGCAVATGVGTVTTSAGAEPGSSAVVIGCGGIGLAMIQGARLAGCDPIVAIDLVDDKLDLAVRLGATDTVNARTESPADAITAIAGAGVDYAFDSVGNAATVDTALEVIRPGGAAVVAGMHAARTELPIPMGPLVMKAKTLMGAFGGSMRPRVDLPRLLELYRDGRLRTDQMITQRYKLDELSAAFADMEAGRGGRSVIVFDEEE